MKSTPSEDSQRQADPVATTEERETKILIESRLALNKNMNLTLIPLLLPALHVSQKSYDIGNSSYDSQPCFRQALFPSLHQCVRMSFDQALQYLFNNVLYRRLSVGLDSRIFLWDTFDL
ncbi:hypothetical protein M758_4G030400 [Ceratodon purpureus]|nr:hypothetical protein M758_4G030400 [Ceratodon purpureus]